MIKCSIIIPHYNIPMLLERCLDSIPVRDDYEVIVIDDISTEHLDEYELVKHSYSDRNILFLDNDTGYRSAGRCRNIGLSVAAGEWILFADADDYFSEGAWISIERDMTSELDIVFYYPTSADSDTGELSDRHYEYVSVLEKYMNNSSLENELLLRFQLVSPWSKLIKNEMLVKNAIRFDETPVANDVMFCRKIGYYAKRIGVKKDVIYVVTTRAGSLTKTMSLDNFYTRLNVFIDSSKYIKNMLEKDKYKLLHLNGSYFLHMCREYNLGVGVLFKTAVKLMLNGICPINL